MNSKLFIVENGSLQVKDKKYVSINEAPFVYILKDIKETLYLNTRSNVSFLVFRDTEGGLFLYIFKNNKVVEVKEITATLYNTIWICEDIIFNNTYRFKRKKYIYSVFTDRDGVCFKTRNSFFVKFVDRKPEDKASFAKSFNYKNSDIFMFCYEKSILYITTYKNKVFRKTLFFDFKGYNQQEILSLGEKAYALSQKERVKLKAIFDVAGGGIDDL